MENDDIRQDQHEITGLIYLNKQPVWATLITDFLILDTLRFATNMADEFDALTQEAIANHDERSAMDMTMVAEQLRYWAENGEGVTWTLPYFGLRQLVNPSVVGPDNLVEYMQRVMILAKVPGLPKEPDFVVLAGEQKALYVTSANEPLVKYAGGIESMVLNQKSLNKISGDLIR